MADTLPADSLDFEGQTLSPEAHMLPKVTVIRVISLYELSGHLTMTEFPDWRQRMASWPEVPILRCQCANLFPAQTFDAAIECLFGWFQLRGFTLDQARRMSLSEAAQLISAASQVIPIPRSNDIEGARSGDKNGEFAGGDRSSSRSIGKY